MKVLLVVKSKQMETLGVCYLKSVIQHDKKNSCRIVDLKYADKAAIEWKPDIVGYSCLTGDVESFRKIDEHIRLALKNPPKSLVGGADATFFPEGYHWADMVVRGEAEQYIANFCGTGQTYKDINSFPWPARDDFPNYKIRDFIASRGCSYGKCGYCYNGAWEKMFPDVPKVRIRDAKDVVAEIKSTNPEFVYFQDATFGASIKWLREFSLRYKQEVNAPYHSHLRPDQVTDERTRLLSDSHCISVKIALETSSDRLRTLINRGDTNNEDVCNAASLLKKHNISLILQNILGLPAATIEDDLNTLEINIKCKPAYSWSSIFQPYPMLPLSLICEKEGYYSGDYSEIKDNFFDESVLNFTPAHKEQIACLQRIFAFCVEMQDMPTIKDLTWHALPKYIHNTMRKVGDHRMFKGIL